MNRYIPIGLLMCAIASGVAFFRQDQHDQHHDGAAPQASGLAVPSSIQAEHRHLHEQLEAAIAAGGTTGERAKAVAAVLGPHFEEEEAFAMPPLGLLEALAHDKPVTDEQVRGAIEMSDRLRGDYEKMLKEHQQIQEALRALATAAEQEHHPEHAAFAHNLMAHAQNEEQVLYPATLLIGQYLKLRHGDVEKAGAPHPEVR
jgi:hypothetical protein